MARASLDGDARVGLNNSTQSVSRPCLMGSTTFRPGPKGRDSFHQRELKQEMATGRMGEQEVHDSHPREAATIETLKQILTGLQGHLSRPQKPQLVEVGLTRIMANRGRT